MDLAKHNDGYRLCFLNERRFEKCLRQIAHAQGGQELVEDIMYLLEFITAWDREIISGLER